MQSCSMKKMMFKRGGRRLWFPLSLFSQIELNHGKRKKKQNKKPQPHPFSPTLSTNMDHGTEAKKTKHLRKCKTIPEMGKHVPFSPTTAHAVTQSYRAWKLFNSASHDHLVSQDDSFCDVMSVTEKNSPFSTFPQQPKTTHSDFFVITSHKQDFTLVPTPVRKQAKSIFSRKWNETEAEDERHRLFAGTFSKIPLHCLPE